MSDSVKHGSSDGQGELEDQMNLVEDEIRRIPTRERVDRVERRANRGVRAAVAIAALIAVVAAAISGWNSYRISENTAATAITAAGVESLRKANEALEEKGLPPIPVPREGENLDANAVAAAAAAMVRVMIDGDPQFKGDEGKQGDPCVPEVPGCAGTDGTNGTNGRNGSDGVTPPCLNEPSQCRGADGLGVDRFEIRGANLFVVYSNGSERDLGRVLGQNGADGNNATACPPGWSQQRRVIATDQNLLGELVIVCVSP